MNNTTNIQIETPRPVRWSAWLGRWQNLQTAWRNWRVRGTGRAYRALTKAMRDDPDFAHSWQCNIAMPILDGAKGKLTHAEANAIADELMQHLFEVKRPNESSSATRPTKRHE